MEQRLDFQQNLLADLQGRNMKEHVITGEREREMPTQVVSDKFKQELRVKKTINIDVVATFIKVIYYV